MPTYAFRCERCGRVDHAHLSIREYMAAPPTFFCCSARMERFFEVVPGIALGNAMASERHYDGMRATDGTPIDTRAKHREYMRTHNVTTADDFADTWKRAARERTERLAGTDPTRAQDVADALRKHSG